MNIQSGLMIVSVCNYYIVYLHSTNTTGDSHLTFISLRSLFQCVNFIIRAVNSNNGCQALRPENHGQQTGLMILKDSTKKINRLVQKEGFSENKNFISTSIPLRVYNTILFSRHRHAKPNLCLQLTSDDVNKILSVALLWWFMCLLQVGRKHLR